MKNRCEKVSKEAIECKIPTSFNNLDSHVVLFCTLLTLQQWSFIQCKECCKQATHDGDEKYRW